MLSTSTGNLGLAFLISFSTSRPLRPGIVISSTTTSHSCFQMESSTSCPLRASPKADFLNSSASICFKPCRTMAWSSAIRIFMFALIRLYPSRQRNPHRHRGSLARHTRDLQLPLQQSRALAHAQHADRPRVVQFRLGYAAPVVPHLEHQRVFLLPQLHFHPPCLGVPNDVRQGLLENPEKRRVQILVQDRLLHVRTHHALDP